MIERLWERDVSLWPGPPMAIANRLGWLAFDTWLADHLLELQAFARQITDTGYTTAVVLGMGGSSAAARVLVRLGDATPGGLRVLVLDSTVPAAVHEIAGQIDPGRTLFIVSSKSGETVETLAFMDYFTELYPRGEDFIAITDAGTPLHAIAVARGFRRVFLHPADIGGRFSALSYPSLVPAALAGVDLSLLAAQARAMDGACRQVDVDANPGAQLAAQLAHLALEGRGVLFVEDAPRLAGLDDWLSQLVAESMGKHGLGILPIRVSSPLTRYAEGDTVFVCGDSSDTRAAELERAGCTVIHCMLSDPHGVAAEFVRWEIGVALASSLIGLNAFDEPDVASAKRATAVALGSDATRPSGMERGTTALAGCALAPTGNKFIAIHAYVERTPAVTGLLDRLRQQLSDCTNAPVAIEYGPALLHATGQYYKGGPSGGLVIQVIEPDGDSPILGRRYSFATLLAAQAQGDASAMLAAGRRVASATLGELQRAIEEIAAARTALPTRYQDAHGQPGSPTAP